MQFKKLLAAAAIGAAFIGGSLATTPALAQGHYHGGYGGGYHGGYYGGWHGGYGYGYGGWRGGYWGPGVGFYFGPGFYPGAYWGGGYPGYYGYPYLAADPGPQTYVEQAQQQAQPDAQSYSWYRCDSANGTYYPYVKTCPGGWTKVAPSAPQ